jgi:hypothetical protein
MVHGLVVLVLTLVVKVAVAVLTLGQTLLVVTVV